MLTSRDMQRRVVSPPSKLEKLKPAIAAVLPRGLPKEVAKFYGKSDGLRVTLGDERATLVGLAEMFGGLTKGAFRKHAVVKKAEVDELAWTDLPFYEQFFNEHGDVVDKKSLDSLNLRMRLKLLSTFEGESTDLAIDYYDTTPTMYVVDRADAAYPLKDLRFTDLVSWFSKFGTRRWYYAFLDKKAQERMNIDLRAELESSLAEFPAAEWAPLLARMPKKAAPKAKTVVVERARVDKGVDGGAFPALAAPPVVIPDGGRRVAFTADGKTLVAWDGNYGLSTYDVATRKRVWRQKNAQAMAVSRDGVVAVLEHDAASEHATRFVVRTIATGKPVHAKPCTPGGSLTTLAVLGNGAIAVAATDDTVRAVDATTLQVGPALELTDVQSIAAAGPGARAVVHGQRRSPEMQLVGPTAVRLVDLEAGTVVTTWAGASSMAISADGALVALRYLDAQPVVRIVDAAANRVLHEVVLAALKPGNDPAYGFHLAFSPEGTRLVISESTYDASARREMSTISVYDTKTGARTQHAELGTDPKRPTSTIDADGIAVSADGVLCVATDSYGLRLWRLGA